MRQLLDRVDAEKLEITRNGRNYIGLRDNKGKRFRVMFCFINNSFAQKVPPLDSLPLPGGVSNVRRYDEHWIYALTAHSPNGDRKACYVGQTTDLKRKFREHLCHNRPGRSSFALFEWADKEHADIRVTVLAMVFGDQWRAARFKGYWLKMATEAGFVTLNAHNWGRLPLPHKNEAVEPAQWPEQMVLDASVSLQTLVKQNFAPTELFVVGWADQPDVPVVRANHASIPSSNNRPTFETTLSGLVKAQAGSALIDQAW